jgi:hypothetical protein
MPSKIGTRRKPVPAILRTPMEYTEFEAKRAISRQFEVRLRAVFDYYGVDQEAPSAALQLIELMAKDRFPSGFKRVPKGTPRTKRPTWDFLTRKLLVRTIDGCLLQGMTQEQAARTYIADFCPERSSCKGLVAEYHRAKKWLQEYKPTDLERIDYELVMAEIESE